jgi:RND family efflux transporter MFP subunit
MKKWIVILLVLVTGSAVAYKWTDLRDKYLRPAKLNGPKTALVESKDIQFSINAAGDIGPADQVSVRPEINGKIESLRVDIGDKVIKGSILFTLDDKDLQTERASRMTEIEGAKLELDRARRNHDRAEQLYKDKLISQELYEDTRTNFELAKNSLDRAQRSLEQVEERLTKTKIAAPFDCTILTRPVSMGQAVSGSGGFNSGTEVLTVANLNEMIINAHINQADVTRLKVGLDVDIEVEAIPGLKLKGGIERLAPQATVRNGIKGFATRVLLKNVDERVRPGMTANISIPIASASNVLAVPLSAVYTEQGERYVYVRKGEQFERVPVQIGVADFFFVEVQSGLTAGLEVALEQPPGMEKDKTQDGPVVPGSKGKLAGNKDTNTVVLSQVAAATNRSGAKQLAGSAATNSTVLPRRTQ